MKNKGLAILICIVTISVICSILYVFNLKSIDSYITNKKWYHYDYKTGYYDIFYISNNEILYYKPTNNNTTDEYSFCKSYSYNKNNQKIKLDCGKIISIKSIQKNLIELEIDGIINNYYLDINDSINNEFYKYYELSIDKYIEKNKHTLEIIKMSEDKLIDIVNDDYYSKIIFIGNNCKNVECALVNDVIEKWISFSKNVYYIDSSNLNSNILNKLNKLDSNISNDINTYNDIYPLVYVVSNKKLVDSYKIICNGFSCSNYYNK